MRVMLVLMVAAGCTGGGTDEGSGTDDDTGDSAAPVEQRPEPVYTSGETCPTFIDNEEGENEGFISSGEERKFRLLLPENPEGAPVLFAWHWLGGNSRQVINYMGMEDVRDQGAIVVVPDSNGSAFEWDFTGGPEGNVDLVLFDDILGCLYQEYDVDLDRIYATGMSAGGLWTTYLTMYRSEWLAATAPFSGGTGVFIEYSTPVDDIPVLATWGGVDDLYSGLSFDDATHEFMSSLLADGHFVVGCDHGGGHTLPDDPMGYGWEFLSAHPKNVDPEPYAQGLPSDFPEMCFIAEE